MQVLNSEKNVKKLCFRARIALLFLLKNWKNHWALGVSLPKFHWSLAAGGFAPRSLISEVNFLTTRLIKKFWYFYYGTPLSTCFAPHSMPAGYHGSVRVSIAFLVLGCRKYKDLKVLLCLLPCSSNTFNCANSIRIRVRWQNFYKFEIWEKTGYNILRGIRIFRNQ